MAETEPTPAPSTPAPFHGLRFALLAHPAVSGVRSLTKLALPWFFTTEELGEAALAGLIVFGVQHLAVFGLDEALVGARSVGGSTWRAMRKLHLSLSIVLGVLVALIGGALLLLPKQALLGELLIALSPLVVVANRATLPAWLVVRERRYRDAFLIDLGAIAAFAAATIIAAELGAGAWSLVYGWHAQGLASLALASRFARPLIPRDAGDAAEWPAVRRTGGQLCAAAALNYAGERSDGLAVGFVLGRGVLGLYEAAGGLAGALLGYTQSLAERLLFPTLAAHGRARGLGAAYLEALRTTVVLVLPAHVALALCAPALIVVILPDGWHGAGPLAELLALAAGARCFELVALTALKAENRPRAVLHLGVARLVLLAIALLIALPHGLRPVAYAVLATRALCGGIALCVASTRLDLAPHRSAAGLARAGTALAAWAVLAVPAALAIEGERADVGAPWRALLIASACVLAWAFARWMCDRERFASEWQRVRARFARGAAA